MFTVVGERINTSRKKVNEAVASRNAVYIIEDVKKQIEAGATYIDVNAGARIGHEMEDMQWLLKTIRAGFGEIELPAAQPGSSIMPGKIIPVIPEMIMQTW